MVLRLPGRLAAATALTALSGTALVALSDPPGFAADATVSNATPIAYTCHTQFGNFPITNTFTAPVNIESGAGAPAIPITDDLTFGTSAAGLVGQLINQGGLSTIGGTLEGGFGLYGSGYDTTFTVPPLQLTGLTGSVMLDGEMVAPSAGVGAEQLTSPLVMTLTIQQGALADPLKVNCTLDDETTAAIGTLNLTEHQKPTRKTTAKAGPNETLIVTGPNGAVTATTKVKGKAKSVKGTIKKGHARLHYARLKLAKGKHTFTVRTRTGKATVTVTVR